ncbi:MAG: hypothetical protein NTY15_11465 [Planctomycetota bacterium]|nr:hypothetical protein [Planctomycetota bacterium]
MIDNLRQSILHVLNSLFLCLTVLQLFCVIALKPGALLAQSASGNVEAIASEPYGVARLTIPAGQLTPATTLRILVSDPSDRVMFPAIDFLTSEPPAVHTAQPSDRPRLGNGALIGRIRSAIQNAKEQIDPLELVRVQFLFRGNEPFQVRLSGDLETTIDVKPIVLPEPSPNLAPKGATQALHSSAQFQALMRSWWGGYVEQAKRQVERSDYPSIVESYLTHMLAYRYGFELPELVKKTTSKRKQTDPLPTIALVAGVAELRAELFQESLRKTPPQNLKLVPRPEPPRWVEAQVPYTPENLTIEPIAKVVPPECYYLRFASFSNYLWFQSLSETRGGDLAQMAVLRGFNYETNKRMERLLNTKTSAVAKLFGDSIIGDMAIIGQDLYLQEGPSLGVVFEAKNIALLKSSLTSERVAAAKKMAEIGCKLEEISVGGEKVSLLSTPDNQVRSFMVERGSYIFLTTSRRLVERFLEVTGGGVSLGDSSAFRFARLMMPVENKYDIFVYLSSEFFRNLVSPQYQIELRRRLKAIAAIEIAELASLTCAAETGIQDGIPTIERLSTDGYLPPGFQTRVDGSQTLSFSGSWHDSLRGKRGSFLPIADIEINDCSVEEAQSYRDQANFYATQWQQTDPLMVGVRRFSGEPGERLERLALEAYIAPLGQEKYGWLSSMLAPPVRTHIQLPPDDVINFQAHLAGQSTSRSFSPDHVMFAGLKDMVPPVPGETKGLLATLRMLQSLPAYLGAWPRPGYLDRLPLGLGGGPPDAFGFSKLFIGAWRWQMGGFSVLSFDRSILENCALYFKPVPAEDFAQGRAKIGDLEKSKLSAWFNTFWFRRAAQTTRGNLMLLDSLQQQLKVAPQQALASAERLLDAKLQCSLGGTYSLEPAQASGTEVWTSTAWPKQFAMMNGKPTALGFDATMTLPPIEYKAPWLQWFRGAELRLTQLPERLIVVGTIDIEPLPPNAEIAAAEKSETALPKMELDLFNLPFKFFQGDKPKNEKGNEKKPTETRKSF